MPFPKPVAVQIVPELEASRVRFDDGTVGDYYVRGGICWPSIQEVKGHIEAKGHVVMCAVNIRTGRCNVFESEPFNVVTCEVRDGYANVKMYPLGPILNRLWATWYASSFYWHDHGETHTQFRTQVVRDTSILPKPRLINIEWADDGAAEQVFWTASATGMLAMEERVYKDVTITPTGEWCPARHALVCALVGMQRRPWRLPENRPEYENEDAGKVNLWRHV